MFGIAKRFQGFSSQARCTVKSNAVGALDIRALFRLANGFIFFFQTAWKNFTGRSSEFILDENYAYFDDLSLAIFRQISKNL